MVLRSSQRRKLRAGLAVEAKAGLAKPRAGLLEAKSGAGGLGVELNVRAPEANAHGCASAAGGRMPCAALAASLLLRGRHRD